MSDTFLAANILLSAVAGAFWLWEPASKMAPNIERPTPQNSKSSRKSMKPPQVQPRNSSRFFQWAWRVSQAERQLEETREKCDKLQGDGQVLRKELVEAHDFVFSLQPQRQQITETEASAEFKFLCDSIQNWVETNLGDAIEHRVMTKDSPGQEPAEKFTSYISPSDAMASKLCETEEHIIATTVMKFLCNNLFDRNFYCGIGKAEMKLLRRLEESMRRSEPPRDLFTRRCWRSETFTALTNMPDFQKAKDDKLKDLVDELQSMLDIFLPLKERESEEIASSISHHILEPAFSLAHRLHLSVDRYTVEWSDLSTKPPEMRSRDPQSYGMFDCKDYLKGGKAISPQALADAASVTYILDVRPALVLQVAKANGYAHPKILCKNCVLVVPMRKGKGGFVPEECGEGGEGLVYSLIHVLSKRR